MVGLNSKYLDSVAPSHRPPGVVFVDLDQDIVHLGVDDAGADSQHGTYYGRPTPPLPEKDASKLKSKLDECGGAAYLPPECGIIGRITYGHGEHMPNSVREDYSREAVCEGDVSIRVAVLQRLDWAWLDDHYREGVQSFVTDAGTIADRGNISRSPTSKGWKTNGINKRSGAGSPRKQKASEAGGGGGGAISCSSSGDSAGCHLLELEDEVSKNVYLSIFLRIHALSSNSLYC